MILRMMHVRMAQSVPKIFCRMHEQWPQVSSHCIHIHRVSVSSQCGDRTSLFADSVAHVERLSPKGSLDGLISSGILTQEEGELGKLACFIPGVFHHCLTGRTTYVFCIVSQK